jgi:hypothetical protein
LALAADNIVFNGAPSRKIVENGTDRQVTNIPSARKWDFQVKIKQDGQNDFVWVSNKNHPMFRTNLGAYECFVAKNGAGYVMVQDPDVKHILGTSHPHYAFDYVEHQTDGLSSVTYYGTKAD